MGIRMNKTKQKKLMLAKGMAVTIFIMIFLVYLVLLFGNAGEKKLNALLDLGNKYLNDMDYESAAVTFDQAITIDPKCEEAYWGKASAQFAMGQYEEAIATLEEGISNVEGSSRLTEFLQQILAEYIGASVWDTDNINVEVKEAQAENILLNYLTIVRFVDTEDPEIQMEVLGDEGNGENYTWVSSNTDCVSVSKTGNITCKQVEGYAYIYAQKGNSKSNECVVIICTPDYGNESETMSVKADEKKQDYTVTMEKGEDGERAVIDVLGKNIYYSGDIVIPERLQIGEKEVTITGISYSAFRWSDKLDSIYIPATVKGFGTDQNEMQENRIDNPFYFCKKLENIEVDEENEFLKDEDGVLYSKDGTILYAYPAGKKGDRYTIPKEVERVCTGAFLGCENLKEILVETGNQHYEAIDGVLIEKETNYLVVYPIGSEATSYIVPDEVRGISADAFYGSSLEEVDCSSVEEIFDTNFKECKMLKRIKGGENTTRIYWMDGKSESVEFTGIDTMKKLSQFRFKASATQNFSDFAALESLMTLRIDAAGQSLNLESIGKIPALSEFELNHADGIRDFSWISDMESLKYLRVDVEKGVKEETILKEIKNLKNLESLYISKFENLTDLSWLEEMKSLNIINLKAEEFSVTDLSSLLTLENLSHVNITSLSSDRNELGEDVKRQIEEMKTRKPEIDIHIWDWE